MNRFPLPFCTTLAATAVWLLTGCASSTLQLDLAMYHGDPSYGGTQAGTLPEEIARASAAVARARSLATQANACAAEATTLFEAYRAVFLAKAKASGNPDAEEDLTRLRDWKEKYLASLAQLASELPGQANLLESATGRLRESAQQLQADPTNAAKATAVQKARTDVGIAFASIQAVVGAFDPSAGAAYVGWMRQQMPKFVAKLTADLQPKPKLPAKDGTHQSTVSDAAINAEVQSAIASALQALRPLLSNQPQLLSDITDARDLLEKTLPALERALPSATETVAAKTTEVATSANAITSATLFHDMMEFDNLQNAADPRWRVVKDPRNESNWVELKNQTYFYSEGKNSVVVVRDRPDDFRVQNASNNPTALIRSQLEISRAVTNAAIAIGGAAAGVPKLTAFVANTAAPADDSTAGEQQAADAARIAEETRQRNAMLSELRVRLRQAQSNLDAAQSDATKIRAAADEFYAIVQAAKALLPAPALTNPAAGNGGSGSDATPPATSSSGSTSGTPSTSGSTTASGITSSTPSTP